MAEYRLETYDKVVSTDGTWAVTRIGKHPDTIITVNAKTKASEVCKALKAAKAIPSDSTMRKIEFSDFDSDIIEVRLKKDRKPLCRLEIKRS